jgi:hypothetical protein
MVTLPEAPETHCANPCWEIVAMFESDESQLPEYGAVNVTGAGDGGIVKVPVAVNCT